MSESKHTPGPWFACAGDDCAEMQRDDGTRGYFPHVHIGPIDHGRKYIGADGHEYAAASQSICVNSTTEGAPMEEHDANARLIAASPLMLGALQTDAMDAHDALARLPSIEWVGHAETRDIMALIGKLRERLVAIAKRSDAAIAKATGGAE